MKYLNICCDCVLTYIEGGKFLNILCPISNIEELYLFIQENVSEMYFGINNNNVIFNNRRPSALCNMEKTKELKHALLLAKKNNIRLNLVCNAFIYPTDKLEYILEDIYYAYDCGVRDIIISDINLLLYIKDKFFYNDLKFNLSTCAPVYNMEAISFYKSLGISRICFPRHLTLSEMQQLAENNKDLEFEAFALNVRCINEDGFCCFEHGFQNYSPFFEGGGCQLKYNTEAIVNERVDNVTKQIIEKRFECVYGNFISACAACMLPIMKKSNINFLKIAGREFTVERKIRDVRFLKQCINYIDKFENLTEYQIQVKKLYERHYNRHCDITQCYYK